MSLRALTLSAAVSAIVLLPSAAGAADAAIVPAARMMVQVEPQTCLRWVWQQYSWYDDCWASRHPYIAGRRIRR
jgi:hypothetical protein